VLAPSPEQIMSLVTDYFEITREQLMASRRGKENLPRDFAIYLIRRHSRTPLKEIGSLFAISKYSSVSSVIERIKKRSKEDRKVQHYVKELEKNLPDRKEK
jgi:chromosomal replication initiation ATPase DnaA